MKKENIYKLLCFIAIILIIGFFIKLGIDYFNYDSYNNSIPFYVYILESGLKFMVPSVIIFVVSRIVNKKYNLSRKNK